MLGLLSYLRANAAWLGAGFLLTFMSSFGQTFLISVFAGDIRRDFGLTNGGWGGIYALGTMAAALAMMIAGGATDRFRVRHVGAAMLVGLAAAAVLMANASGLWSLAFAVFLLRFFGQGMMSHTAMVAMSRWFVATRGRAVSIAGLGFSVGEALLPIVFVALLGLFDWRLIWTFVAVALIAVAPVLYTILRRERTPQSFSAAEGRAGMEGRHWARAEVLAHPLFWALVPALVGLSGWNTAFFFHQVHLAEARGISHAQLVAQFPIYTITCVGFMLLAGWVADRFGVARLTAVYLFPVAAGYVVLALGGSTSSMAISLLLMGVTVGLHTTVMGALWAEFYGTAHVGAIRSMTAVAMVAGSAIGPGLSGWLIDLGFAFPEQGWGIAVYFVLAGLVVAVAILRAERTLPLRVREAAGTI